MIYYPLMFLNGSHFQPAKAILPINKLNQNFGPKTWVQNLIKIAPGVWLLQRSHT